MILCLDVGNTHIVGGLFIDDKLKLRFRYATNLIGTADQFGIFLNNIFENKNMDISKVETVAISSVVPSCNFTIKHAISSYLPSADYYQLNTNNIQNILKVKYDNPQEVGADLLASAIGAIAEFQNENLIIIDLGTATTITAVTKTSEFLGGVIMPGLKLAVDSLTKNAAKLTEIDIDIPQDFLGSNTKSCIQSGIYFGHLGAMREIIKGYKQEIFKNSDTKIIATGGFTSLFKDADIFTKIIPDLVLNGLKVAYESQNR